MKESLGMKITLVLPKIYTYSSSLCLLDWMDGSCSADRTRSLLPAAVSLVAAKRSYLTCSVNRPMDHHWQQKLLEIQGSLLNQRFNWKDPIGRKGSSQVTASGYLVGWMTRASIARDMAMFNPPPGGHPP